ncbi:MAG: hypothetical protein ACRCY3_03900 [Sphingorhabdus sp.]
MSYFLFPSADSQLLGSRSPLIKRAERVAFSEAATLLAYAGNIAQSAEAQVENARLEAIEKGHAEGSAKAQTDLDAAIQGFGDAIRQIEALHAEQVAEAAYAATIAIIGELDDKRLVERLVGQVLAKQKDQTGLVVHVAPELQPQLTGLFGEDGTLPVIANSDLAGSECHVMTAKGRIIASLSVQLPVLRERWGLGESEKKE